mmetsp:Transcript_45776/g.145917  ORF Transcript_45776/g.145917 Transcript_45776/m.145917 type:complete len:140 (-) Transcript_45776:160-579(-)
MVTAGARHVDVKVSSELKKAIMQARLDKKLTQAQLANVRPRPCGSASLILPNPWGCLRVPGRASHMILFMRLFGLSGAIHHSAWRVILPQPTRVQMINEKPQTVQEYESGKAIPNQQIIGKLERALGAKLRGKKGPAKK